MTDQAKAGEAPRCQRPAKTVFVGREPETRACDCCRAWAERLRQASTEKDRWVEDYRGLLRDTDERLRQDRERIEKAADIFDRKLAAMDARLAEREKKLETLRERLDAAEASKRRCRKCWDAHKESGLCMDAEYCGDCYGGLEAALAERDRESAALAAALRLVLGSTLLEADGHDWQTCEQLSCKAARAALAKR